MPNTSNMAASLNQGQRQQHHRVISTNNLFSSFGLDVMQQDTLTGICVAPTERIAQLQFNPTLSQAALSGAHQPLVNPEQNEIERARFHARGLQAGVDMAPMFGDRPPQSPQSPTRPRAPSTQLPSAYNQGMGIDTSTHYSFQPNVLLHDKEVDHWMAEWEKELFTNYRRTKYYSGYEEMSKEKTAEIVVGFTGAALQAYKKLETAAKSDAVSDGFKLFVNGLGGFESLTRSGFRNLDKVLEGGTPQNLTGVYSVLHVAYAMSQTTSDQIRQLPDAPTIDQFKQDARRNWRQCLPKEKNDLGYYERAVFDELLVVMTQEVDSALQWIKERTYMNQLTNSEEQEDQNNTEFCTISPEPPSPDSDFSFDAEYGVLAFGLGPNTTRSQSTPDGNPMQTPSASKWIRLLHGTILKNTVHFLNELSNLGVMFHRLCGLPYFSLRGRQTNALDPDLDFEKFKKMIYCLVVAPTFKMADWKPLIHIMQSATGMLEFGAIRTLRDFENQIVMTSSFVSEKPTRNRFLRTFIVQCAKAANYFGKYSRHHYQTPYSVNYIRRRLEEESALVESQIPQANRQMDEFDSAALWHPRASFDGPMPTGIANSLGPSPAPILSRSLSVTSNGFQGAVGVRLGFDHTILSRAYTPNVQPSSSMAGLNEIDLDAPSDNSQQLVSNGAQNVQFNPTFGFSSQGYLSDKNMSASPPGQSPIDSSSPNGSASSFSSHSSPNTNFSDIVIPQRALAFNPETFVTEFDGTLVTAPVFQSEPCSVPMLPTSCGRKTQRRGRRQAEGRKFLCDVPGCGAEIRGSKFTMSNSNLLRHKRSAHPDQKFLNMEFQCLVENCTGKYRGARGMENLKTHYRTKHHRKMSDEEANMITRLAGDDTTYFATP